MRILLAEDDPLLGDGLRAGLRQPASRSTGCVTAMAAERELRAQPYAAAVLDLGLPRWTAWTCWPACAARPA
jgi:DNA-binding response OmpR family regulator